MKGRIFRGLVKLVIVTLITISFVPSVTPLTMTSSKNVIINEFGSIYGSVYEASFFENPSVVGAKLVLETEGITKTTYTGIIGGFEFKNLPIGLTYTITASHPKYDTKVYTYTLSPDKPDLKVAMNLYRKDDSITRDINKDESCGGTIYGYTLESHDTWGAYPVPLALVDAGVKQTISSPIMGYYRIPGLPFNQEITITASKKGYYSDTLKHTFTELRPAYYYCFDLQEDEDDIKPKLKTSCTGKIYETVFGEIGSFQAYIPFVSIEIERIEKKRCGIQGRYEFKGLALGKKYTLIADAHDYYSSIENVTLIIGHTEEDCYFYLEQGPNKGTLEKSNLHKETLTLKKGNNNGRIYGYTVSSFGWSWNPISNVLVTTGLQGKSTVSDGYYSISGLPLNIPIKITARKFGYYSDSKTVTLTNDDPEEYLILDIQPIEIESKAKITKQINYLCETS